MAENLTGTPTNLADRYEKFVPLNADFDWKKAALGKGTSLDVTKYSIGGKPPGKGEATPPGFGNADPDALTNDRIKKGRRGDLGSYPIETGNNPAFKLPGYTPSNQYSKAVKK